MAGGGKAARGGLECADAGEVRGLADGSTAVAAKTGCGHACSNGCGLAAAGAARGVVEIPRIARAAVEEILCLVGHEELGAVGGAEDDGAGGEQAVDEDRIFVGNGAAMNGAAEFAAIAGDSNGGFDRDGKAGERAWADARGLSARAGGVEVNQGVELGIEALDLCDVLVEEFARRDGAAPQEGKLFGGRAEGDGH